MVASSLLPVYLPLMPCRMLTIHLADALPVQLVRQLEMIDDPGRRRRQLDLFLDRGYGGCALADPDTARLGVDVFGRHDGIAYHLQTWAVMPNHVHVLLQLTGCRSLAAIVAAWKQATASTSAIRWQRGHWNTSVTTAAVSDPGVFDRR